MNIDKYQKNNIIYKNNDFYVYIPHPDEIIGFYSVNSDKAIVSLKNLISSSVEGNINLLKYIFFYRNEMPNEWWNFLLEYKNQLFSKAMIEPIVNQMKLDVNKYNYLHECNRLDCKLYEQTDVKFFFKLYDFCNQSLSSGKYNQNPNIETSLSLLSNQIILNLMINHIILLQEHLEKSNLQHLPQIDVLNHVITHITFSYWDFQKYMTV